MTAAPPGEYQHIHPQGQQISPQSRRSRYSLSNEYSRAGVDVNGPAQDTRPTRELLHSANLAFPSKYPLPRKIRPPANHFEDRRWYIRREGGHIFTFVDMSENYTVR